MMARRSWFCEFTGAVFISVGIVNIVWAENPKPAGGKTIRLFNGVDFDNWYVFTTETGNENRNVFQIDNGTIYVPGGYRDTGYFGGLVTKQSFENYRLRLEYKWGETTYGARRNKARDAGVLLHCVGPNKPGPWMTSYEYQIIEGGTGDLLVVNTGVGDDVGNKVTLKCTAETERRDNEIFFKPGGELNTLTNAGRLNWWGRDPDWQDKVGFRGRHDVESPHGDWTQCEIVARGNRLEFYVNGKLVNRATDLSITRGKILLQTEGAEVWYRNIELTPISP